MSHPRFLLVPDVVLDAGGRPVIALEQGDRTGLVDEDRLESMPVEVGERGLCAGIRSLASDDYPCPFGSATQVKRLVISGTAPLGPVACLVWRAPGVLDDREDRGADRLGQVIADRERDLTLSTPLDQLVAGASAVRPKEQLDRLHLLAGDLRDRLLGHRDLIRRVDALPPPGRLAAMFGLTPDHFASAVMTAIVLAEQDWRLGVFGWSYALLLGFALVYLGEHYVTSA